MSSWNTQREFPSNAIEADEVCYAFKRTGVCNNRWCKWRHGPPGGEVSNGAGSADDHDAWVLKVQRQIEYYFSDGNLCKDKFLLTRTGGHGTGFVRIEELCTFNRLKQLGNDSGLPVAVLVREAIEISHSLELSEDNAKVRRSKPLSEVAKAPLIGSMLIGHEPNLYWCAVDMNNLRANVNFLALPPPSRLKIDGPDTWKWVRQDDALWDALHEGVLTTRHLKGILGFHEAQSAEFLGLGHNMVDHGEAISAFQDLQTEPPISRNCTWSAEPFIAREANERSCGAYNAQLVKRATCCMKNAPPHTHSRARCTNLGQLRCGWGSIQEQRALWHLLNASPLGTKMEEIGLCMLDLRRLQTKSTNLPPRKNRWKRTLEHSQQASPSVQGMSQLPPLMGASPDAMLRLSDGELVAVEVKSVCPFFMHSGSIAVHTDYVAPESRNSWPHWRLRGPAENLSPSHLPQVQWEMFVTDTRKNYFISSSALQGSNLFVVERDDEYIDLMLQVIRDFYHEFVLRGWPPTPDFFWDRGTYQELLRHTRLICEKAAVHLRIPPQEGMDLSGLFLDSSRHIFA